MRNLFFLLLFAASTATGQVGWPDDNFGLNGVASINLGGSEEFYDIKALSNGKILCLSKSQVQGASDKFPTVCRLNPDGSLDPTYGLDGFTRLPDQVFLGDFNFVLGLDNDERALVAAQAADNCIVYRLDSNGLLDMSFSFDGKVTVDFNGSIDYPKEIRIQPDNKILLALEVDGGFAVIRLNEDGTFDTTFDSDGKVVLSALGLERTYNLELQSDGKILVCGTTDDGFGDWIAVCRINADGSVDNNFGNNGVITKIINSNDKPYDIASLPDEKIVVVGRTSQNTFSQNGFILKYRTDGSEDTAFETDGTYIASATVQNLADWMIALEVQPDGKIITAGVSDFNASNTFYWIARFNVEEVADVDFNSIGGIGQLDLSIRAMDMLPNGDVVVGAQDVTDSDMRIVKIKTGLNIGVDELESVDVSFYPNPTSDFLNLDLSAFESTNVSVEIIDVSGAVVLRKYLTENSEKLDVLNLATGIYTIRLTSETKASISTFNKL